MMLFSDGEYGRSNHIACSQLTYVTLFHRRLFGKLDRPLMLTTFIQMGENRLILHLNRE